MKVGHDRGTNCPWKEQVGPVTSGTRHPNHQNAVVVARQTTRNISQYIMVVPEVGLEPTSLSAGDFESPASTIPPLGHWG